MRILSLRRFGFLALAGMLVAPSAQSNDIEPGKEFYTATRAAGAIVLDGNLSEWTGVPVLADPKFSIPKGSGDAGTLVLFEEYQGGTWTGPDDHTSAVQVVYDANNVYLGIVVTDDYHENALNSAWNGDSIQIMIANASRDVQVALYNYGLGGVEDAIGELVETDRHQAGPGGDEACNCPTEVFIKRDIGTKKTTYEIKLPAAALGLATLTPDTKFGLGMAINDGDEATPGQKGWGGLGAHSIVFGKTPSETALVTLGTATAGADRLFFSAINPTIDSFSFRATDKGTSIVDPASARLTIDGQTVTPTASPKTGDATDFTYRPAAPFPPNSDHTYTIEVKDTQGSTVTDSGTFRTVAYALLTAADKVTADTAKPGFIWNVHQNPGFTATDNTRPLLQLAGLLGENFADPNATGPASGPGTAGANNRLPVSFVIPGTINFDEAGGSNGDFQPDDLMPGIPGTSETNPTDGIAAEIITYLDLPAGRHTIIVNSDDGFRTMAGRDFRDLFAAKVAGEFNGGRGAADTSFTVVVEEAGVYGFRTVWQEGGGGANIEWKSQKTDGTRVLLNDTANGGFAAYQATTTSLPAYVKAVSPAPGGSTLTAPKTIEAVLADAGTQIDANSVTLKLNGANVTATATKTAGETRVTHTIEGALQSDTEYTAELTYSDGTAPRTVTWTFKTGPLSSILFVIESEDFDYDGGKANPQKGTAGLDVDVMPYQGGAYIDLGAIEGIDFVNGDGPDSDVYRTELGDDGDHEVNIAAANGIGAGNGLGGTTPITSNDRGNFTVTSNYRIGWVAAGEWQNYTRTFPDNGMGGWWKVYAALSYDGNTPGQLAGSLSRVTAGVGTAEQTVEAVGQFSGPGSGGWGVNSLVPMKNASGGDALVKLVGVSTVRFNLGSGDFDFLIFSAAAPPPPFVELAPQDSAKRGEVVLDWTLRDTDAKVNASTIKVFVDGQDSTAKATSAKTATGATIHLDLTGTEYTPGEHAWRLTFSDDGTPAQNATAEGKFVVNPYPTPGVFVIESEDFNYSDDGVTGGKTNPQKGTADLDVDVMPYLGGAYDGLSAVEGVDYNNNDGEDSLAYRTEQDETGGNEVNITASNGQRYSNDRGVFELTSNYRIGWVESGSWQNYTRTFPQGNFNVWAALSYDGRADGQLNGSLDLVTSDPTKPDQTTQPLGSFSAPGSGGWGRNELVPMKDDAGAIATVAMGGVQTVRFNLGSGDFDYLLFVPQTVGAQPSFTNFSISGGNLVIEWTGGGTLVGSDSVTGPYTPVTGNPTSPATIPIAGSARFFGIRQ